MMKTTADDNGAGAAETEPKKRKSRAKKPANQDLPNMTGPGVEKPSIPRLNALAKKYKARRDARMAESDPEVKAKSALLEAMHEEAEKPENAGLRVEREGKPPMLVYEFEDDDGTNVVEIAAKEESVKVKLKKDYAEGEM